MRAGSNDCHAFCDCSQPTGREPVVLKAELSWVKISICGRVGCVRSVRERKGEGKGQRGRILRLTVAGGRSVGGLKPPQPVR